MIAMLVGLVAYGALTTVWLVIAQTGNAHLAAENRSLKAARRTPEHLRRRVRP